MKVEGVEAEAPGKVILLGEHAVVYGARALGFPLERRVHVWLVPGSGHIRLSAAEDVVVPPSRRAASPRELVRRALGRWLPRVDVHIRFGFPPMSGLGSSASLAVALLRARQRLEGRVKVPFEAELRATLATERVAHAKPSGLDPAICLAAQPIEFVRQRSTVRVRPLKAARTCHFVVGAVGAHGGTRAVVTRVADLKKTNPQLVRSALDTLGQASNTGIRALAKGESKPLGTAMNLAHGVLSGLGLVSTGVASAVHTARQAGALGAKMSGAGGDGGAFLALYSSKRAAESARDELRLGGVECWVERIPARRGS